MNVSKSPLRRATVLVAGSLIGIAGTVAFASPALAHHNEVSGKSTCVAGEWVVDWTVKAVGDGSPNQKVKWTAVTLSPTGKIDGPKFAINEWMASGETVVGKQRVAATEKSATLTISAEWDNGKTATKGDTVPLVGECKKPEDKPSTSSSPSAPASPSASASTPVPPVTIPEEVPAEPIFELTCDTITIGVDNTKNDSKFTLDFKTSKGEVRQLVIEPGKKDAATFSATEGFSVDVTFTVVYKGKTYTESAKVPFEQPDNCDNGEGGGLPVTGAAAGGVAAGAAGLLAVGGALFFLARRRKVKFTA
ncbi:LPXTG cell wall anchor domain-containing protein [Actinoplanes sp. NEAU-A12]|uniref:LPXTG cell wall anchor domain-containing protein n=1 Tax=Actinoplanes sandaracinus TaxID=3045177 RepID=A0ABT6WD71_9ACTN|nr:LPXTG cell wall anchor domain-containing protein [Actinoplanes sandaracinus]MDI6097676.1 LPXTG cell wall anchor domain-containing protein [Actinoplanes sandaracinus]